jgi:hypothetical protein
MSDTIVSINYCNDVWQWPKEYDDGCEDEHNEKYMWYEIKTTKQEIKVGIEDRKLCCEEFDIELKCQDDLPESKFIGAEVIKVKWGKDKIKKYENENYSDRSACVIVVTNRGALTIVLKNRHNGY